MEIIPSRTTKKVYQSNTSKILGDLWASFNLDLQSNLGLIKVSPRLQVNTSGVTNQGISVAFKSFDANIWTIAGTRVFKSSAHNLISSFTEDSSTGAVTNYDPLYSDMESFYNTIVTSSATKILSKAQNGSGTGAWTERYTLSSSVFSHKLCYSPRYNRLYFFDYEGGGDFQVIKSMDTAFSVATSNPYYISIPLSFGIIYTMEADSTDIWIATTRFSTGGSIDSVEQAYILRWDGISAQITQAYKVKAKGVLALCLDDRGIIHALDSNGALLQFTGTGFEEIGKLPLVNEYLINAIPNGIYSSFIHPNGLYFTRNGTFIALINNLTADSTGTIRENLPSGIWEYSKDTGFIHKQSLSYNPMATSTITDYGQNRISQAGALYEGDIYSTSATGKPTIICGASYYTDSSSTASGIFIDEPLDSIQKYGYFVTSWFLSKNLKDNWNKLYIKFRQFLNSTDKIFLKYRVKEAAPTEITLTWSGISPTTTTFTTSTNVSALVGYEVEVIQGTGSGKCAHIVSVSGSGTYTVVLDEPFTGVTTGTAKARIQNWIKIGVNTDLLTESKEFSINKNSERIQLKCCMQFTGEDELHEIILTNNVSQPLV